MSGFSKWLSNVIANSSSLSKLYVSISQTVGVCLATHTWTGLPAIISYVANAMVYLVPNQAVVKVAQQVAPTAQEVAAAIVAMLQKPAPGTAVAQTTTQVASGASVAQFPTVAS